MNAKKICNLTKIRKDIATKQLQKNLLEVKKLKENIEYSTKQEAIATEFVDKFQGSITTKMQLLDVTKGYIASEKTKQLETLQELKHVQIEYEIQRTNLDKCIKKNIAANKLLENLNMSVAYEAKLKRDILLDENYVNKHWQKNK